MEPTDQLNTTGQVPQQSEPYQPPPEISPPQSQSGSKVIIVFAVIIVLLMGATGFFAFLYFFSQKETPVIQNTLVPTSSSKPASITIPSINPTADWQVYSDTKAGVSFKYPKAWYSKPYKSSTLSIFLDINQITIPEASELITPIHIGYNEFTNSTTNQKSYFETTLAKGVVRYKSLLADDSINLRENLTVGGKAAVQMSGELAPGMLEGEFAEYTLIQLDGKLLVISLLRNKNYQDIYDQIISTVTFTQ